MVAWLVFPLVLAFVCFGCGLLLEAGAGTRLPLPLLLPAGLAAVIVIAQITIATVPRATTPVVVAAALAGIALRPPWRVSWPALRWPLGAAVAVFVLYAAPVVLSGQATFAGYIKLDDTATWFALTDRVMDHGRSIAGLPVSTYYVVLKSYLASGYPVGAFLPLGVGHQLTGQDIAWLFQPYLAFLAAMVSLSLYWIARTALPSSRVAAVAAFAAPLAAITYGYSLWGGAKELMATALVALSAALAADAAREARTGRQLLFVSTAAAATLSALSAGAAIWLAPLLFGALAAGFLYQRRDVPVRQAAVFLPLAAVLAIPAISAASTFVSPGAKKTLTSGDELGNLARPLKSAQSLGIWPTGDFRTNPVATFPAYVLIGVLVFCAVLGVILALRRRSWELPLAVIGVAIALLVVAHFGSPWVDGKAMATAAPAFVLAGMAGAGMVFLRGRRVEGAILAAAILVGVLWSDALAYRDASLAPKHQLSELQTIGKRIGSSGPTLMTDYEPYGARHFLRNGAPEGASEFRWRQVTLRNGTLLPKGQSADIDSFRLDGILVYRNLVLHRGPSASRPPAPYNLVWKGRYWELWQRPVSYPQVVDHLPLGTTDEPGSVPDCATVQAEALRVPAGGRLAAPIREKATFAQLRLVEPGSAEGGALIRETGDYTVWIGGSFGSRARVYLDGRLVGSRRNGLEWEQYQPLGKVQLTSGTVHEVRLVYDGRSFVHPGSGDTRTPIGPVAFSRQTADVPVTYLRPSDAQALCGKNLDWIEALGPG
jgi:hypothetical protein